MELHERLREIREERSLTQSTIANVIHVCQRTYCDYESGKIRMPVDRLTQLAMYYDLCMDYICGTSNIKRKYPKK